MGHPVYCTYIDYCFRRVIAWITCSSSHVCCDTPRRDGNHEAKFVVAFSERVRLAMTFSTCRVGVWRMANYLSSRIESEMSAFGSLKFHLECRNAVNAVLLLSNATKERIRTRLASLCHNAFDATYNTLQRYTLLRIPSVNTLNQSAPASGKEVVTRQRNVI